jgi:hypothetical protein
MQLFAIISDIYILSLNSLKVSLKVPSKFNAFKLWFSACHLVVLTILLTIWCSRSSSFLKTKLPSNFYYCSLWLLTNISLSQTFTQPFWLMPTMFLSATTNQTFGKVIWIQSIVKLTIVKCHRMQLTTDWLGQHSALYITPLSTFATYTYTRIVL